MSDKEKPQKPVSPAIKPTTGRLHENSNKRPAPKAEQPRRKDK
jgi:hypothetical protein